MTRHHHPSPGTFAAETGPDSVTIRLDGDLDHLTTDELVARVRALLDERRPAHLHLDFARLGFCDTTGLSGLLMVHRLTSGSGVTLHLDNRTRPLNRLLEVTGTLRHLTAPPGPAGVGTADSGAGRSSQGPGAG
ncbi:MAG TPA: STAS domain-containing protein [Pseudonocardia sp.]|jgi:anti-anti-sigma factor